MNPVSYKLYIAILKALKISKKEIERLSKQHESDADKTAAGKKMLTKRINKFISGDSFNLNILRDWALDAFAAGCFNPRRSLKYCPSVKLQEYSFASRARDNSLEDAEIVAQIVALKTSDLVSYVVGYILYGLDYDVSKIFKRDFEALAVTESDSVSELSLREFVMQCLASYADGYNASLADIFAGTMEGVYSGMLNAYRHHHTDYEYICMMAVGQMSKHIMGRLKTESESLFLKRCGGDKQEMINYISEISRYLR